MSGNLTVHASDIEKAKEVIGQYTDDVVDDVLDNGEVSDSLRALLQQLYFEGFLACVKKYNISTSGVAQKAKC